MFAESDLFDIFNQRNKNKLCEREVQQTVNSLISNHNR